MNFHVWNFTIAEVVEMKLVFVMKYRAFLSGRETEGWATQDQKFDFDSDVWNCTIAEVEDIKFVIAMTHLSLPFGKGDGGMGLVTNNVFII